MNRIAILNNMAKTTSYDDLVKQKLRLIVLLLETLKTENSALRAELQNKSNNLSLLESETSSMMSQITSTMALANDIKMSNYVQPLSSAESSFNSDCNCSFGNIIQEEDLELDQNRNGRTLWQTGMLNGVTAPDDDEGAGDGKLSGSLSPADRQSTSPSGRIGSMSPQRSASPRQQQPGALDDTTTSTRSAGSRTTSPAMQLDHGQQTARGAATRPVAQPHEALAQLMRTSGASRAAHQEEPQQVPSTAKLGTKLEMVHSLLSLLGTHDKEDMSRTLLAMSSSSASCSAMRQSGCLPLLVQLLHPCERNSVLGGERAPKSARARAAAALHNIVHSHPDGKAGRREARVLKLLEQIRAHCDQLRDDDNGTDMDHHPGPAIAALMKLSFDEEHRRAICTLGGLQAIAELLMLDHAVHGATCEQYHVTMRRYACMALTNLTFGDGANKALLCSIHSCLTALVAQLGEGSERINEELCQVAASVLRNLSWRADLASKQSLRAAGAVRALVCAALAVQREPTLKSVLSALWNLSAHCSENKADICGAPGALSFLVAILSYNSQSKTLAIVENGGGILRNVSSLIAVREDFRAVLRSHGALQILLAHLRSPSLTIVSNACGTLWNLSARNMEDQKALWELGAVSMLRSLVHSKHKLISMGSAAALKNLLASRPQGISDGPGKPLLAARSARALEADIEAALTDSPESQATVKQHGFNGDRPDLYGPSPGRGTHGEDKETTTKGSEAPVDYSARCSELEGEKLPNQVYGDDAAKVTDAPVNYSVRFSEGVEEFSPVEEEKQADFYADERPTVYAVEGKNCRLYRRVVQYNYTGTPACRSRTDSFSNGEKEAAENTSRESEEFYADEKPTVYAVEGTAEPSPARDAPAQTQPSRTVEQTPMAFSRSSSVGSLSSFTELPSVNSEYSSMVSRASEVVSESELPDSPGDSGQNTPQRVRKLLTAVSASGQHSVKPPRQESRPDSPKVYACTSEMTSPNGALCIPSTPQRQIQRLMAVAAKTPNASRPDSPHVYATEDTPLDFSYESELSTLGDPDEQEEVEQVDNSKQEKEEELTFTDDDEGDDILQRAIEAGKAHGSGRIAATHNQKHDIPSLIIDQSSSSPITSLPGTPQRRMRRILAAASKTPNISRPDTPKMYATEDTPLDFSYESELSNLDDPEDDVDLGVARLPADNNEEEDVVSDDDDEEGDALLRQVIEAGKAAVIGKLESQKEASVLRDSSDDAEGQDLLKNCIAAGKAAGSAGVRRVTVEASRPQYENVTGFSSDDSEEGEELLRRCIEAGKAAGVGASRVREPVPGANSPHKMVPRSSGVVEPPARTQYDHELSSDDDSEEGEELLRRCIEAGKAAGFGKNREAVGVGNSPHKMVPRVPVLRHNAPIPQQLLSRPPTVGGTDSVRIYATEDTPIAHSRRSSLSDLSFEDEDEFIHGEIAPPSNLDSRPFTVGAGGDSVRVYATENTPRHGSRRNSLDSDNDDDVMNNSLPSANDLGIEEELLAIDADMARMFFSHNANRNDVTNQAQRRNDPTSESEQSVWSALFGDLDEVLTSHTAVEASLAASKPISPTPMTKLSDAATVTSQPALKERNSSSVDSDILLEAKRLSREIELWPVSTSGISDDLLNQTLPDMGQSMLESRSSANENPTTSTDEAENSKPEAVVKNEATTNKPEESKSPKGPRIVKPINKEAVRRREGAVSASPPKPKWNTSVLSSPLNKLNKVIRPRSADNYAKHSPKTNTKSAVSKPVSNSKPSSLVQSSNPSQLQKRTTVKNNQSHSKERSSSASASLPPRNRPQIVKPVTSRTSSPLSRDAKPIKTTNSATKLTKKPVASQASASKPQGIQSARAKSVPRESSNIAASQRKSQTNKSNIDEKKPNAPRRQGTFTKDDSAPEAPPSSSDRSSTSSAGASSTCSSRPISSSDSDGPRSNAKPGVVAQSQVKSKEVKEKKNGMRRLSDLWRKKSPANTAAVTKNSVIREKPEPNKPPKKMKPSEKQPTPAGKNSKAKPSSLANNSKSSSNPASKTPLRRSGTYDKLSAENSPATSPESKDQSGDGAAAVETDVAAEKRKTYTVEEASDDVIAAKVSTGNKKANSKATAESATGGGMGFRRVALPPVPPHKSKPERPNAVVQPFNYSPRRSASPATREKPTKTSPTSAKPPNTTRPSAAQHGTKTLQDGPKTTSARKEATNVPNTMESPKKHVTKTDMLLARREAYLRKKEAAENDRRVTTV